MYGNEVHKYINEAMSSEMVLIVTVCNVHFSLINLGRNLLDMDTFSKSDPGKWIILILQYIMKYKETKTMLIQFAIVLWLYLFVKIPNVFHLSGLLIIKN